MKAKNLNASSEKTRNQIRNTFAEILYEQRSINKITVTDLAQRAGINRSTFYLHYDDVYQVAEDIKNETLHAYFEEIEVSSSAQIESFFDQIYSYNREHDELFHLMFQSEEVTGFVHRLGKLCKDQIYSAMSKDPAIINCELMELEISIVSDGLAMAFIRYYSNENGAADMGQIIKGAKLWCREMVNRRSKSLSAKGTHKM